MKINYVVACWSGKRRYGDPLLRDDCTYYLKKQVETLSKFKHNLDQITFVVPKNKNEPKEFRSYLESLPSKIGSAKVEVTRRLNKDFSYGSWNHAFLKYRGNFKYYIFIEDDYVFCNDNFDDKLVKLFNEKENCGFVFNKVENGHASIPHGITRADVLETVWSKFNGLIAEVKKQTDLKPLEDDGKSRICTVVPEFGQDLSYMDSGQVGFSNAFIEAGYDVYDITDQYSCIYNEHGKIIESSSGNEILIAPVQVYAPFDVPAFQKILILLPYYNRPNLVKNALASIAKANKYYTNWELAFIDDGSPSPGKPIVEEILIDCIHKVKFYNSDMTVEEKKNKGCMLGKYLNKAIQESDADIAIILCDDDELYPEYLFNLNKFLSVNPGVLSCYSNVHIYNPLLEKSEDVDNITGHLNRYCGPMYPFCTLDASQVAWRTIVNKDYDIWFDYPRLQSHDAAFFKNLYKSCGPTVYSGLVSQYKGEHSLQLGNLSDTAWNVQVDKSDVDTNVTREAEFLTKTAIERAVKLKRVGKLDIAIKLCEQVIKVQESFLPWLIISQCQYDQEEFDKAEESLDHANNHADDTTRKFVVRMRDEIKKKVSLLG